MGRFKRGYCLALLLFLVSPVSAEMPPQLDSLKKYVQLATRLEMVPDSVLGWAVNVAIQQVCDDFDALPKIDTVTIRQDSTGAVINSDFLRFKWVMKITGDTMWVPMGEISGDTIYLQVTDTSEAKLRKQKATEPQLYFWHDKLFTHPKYAKDTLAQTFIVAYWATDRWITAADTATFVRPEYRNAVIDYASFLVNRRRGNFNDAAIFKQDYKERLGR